jgi:hypothetical protein
MHAMGRRKKETTAITPEELAAVREALTPAIRPEIIPWDNIAKAVYQADSPHIPPTDPLIEEPSTSEAPEHQTQLTHIQNAINATNSTDPETQTTDPDKDNDAGDNVTSATVGVGESDSASRTGALAVTKRLQKEGRWAEIEPTRDRMMKQAKQTGLDKAAAQAWTYSELDRLYPPLPPKVAPVPAEQPQAAPDTGLVQGLGAIPAAWPALPDNASLQAELGWVQSQRLSVVEERGNTTVVRLERASSPAPSKAALGWLETSIRSYAKYVDIVSRCLATAVDEQESVRRERMAIADIDALLAEMMG